VNLILGSNCRGGPPWPPVRKNVLESERAATEGRPYSCYRRIKCNSNRRQFMAKDICSSCTERGVFHGLFMSCDLAKRGTGLALSAFSDEPDHNH
jgi:hypothetical protein